MASRPPPKFEDEFAERLARLLDRWIKVGPFSIGLDGLLGLIPGIGDVTSGAFSALIVMRAIQSGVPKAAILRMVLNVGIDSLVGSIPLLGDLFDFVFKANMKNLEIYQDAMQGQRDSRRDWGFNAAVFAVLLILIAIPLLTLALLSATLTSYLMSFFRGL
jgi:hypothetical protein